MNRASKEKCSKCNRAFEWNNVGDVWPGGKDIENIVCPHCGSIEGTKMTSGTIEVKKIDSESD